MELSVIAGVIIPFIGTSLGAAFVFFMRKNLSALEIGFWTSGMKSAII